MVSVEVEVASVVLYFVKICKELTADVNSFQGIHVCSHWLDLGGLHSHLLDCWSFKVSLKLISRGDFSHMISLCLLNHISFSFQKLY